MKKIKKIKCLNSIYHDKTNRLNDSYTIHLDLFVDRKIHTTLNHSLTQTHTHTERDTNTKQRSLWKETVKINSV